MPLPPLVGHEGVQQRLGSAVATGRLPQTLLLVGPRGVGKQRLALWLAQLLQCEEPRADGQDPCGECRSCRLVLSLQHPDVHWFVPIELSKKGADADKQIDLVAEALGEEMTARREQPLYAPPSGLAAHPIAAVRLLLRRLALTPAMGNRKIFIVGDADRLIPQRGSEDAANALLKALEEPPADSVIVITTADPNALLPTILSRVVLVRVARIPDTAMTAFAHQALDNVGKAEVAQRINAAEGCIGKLFATGMSAKNSEQAARFLEAVEKGPATRHGFALAQVPFQARGGFTEMLDALTGRLRVAAKQGGETEKLVEAISLVMHARELAQGNVNPQLLAAVLAEDLSRTRRA